MRICANLEHSLSPLTLYAPHFHCPFDCDHPQPFTLAEVQEKPEYQQYAGKTFCGRCYYKDGMMTEMVTCTPETCPGDLIAVGDSH